MSPLAAIDVAHLSHRYGKNLALDDVSLEVAEAEIFVFLGPNGGGKTTLFRILTTLVLPQQGTVRIFGLLAAAQRDAVRRSIGVVFQSPSLDRKLTVAENLYHQGRLYGLTGPRLRSRCNALLDRLGLSDRAGSLVETLSGGLRRRAELAKGMLHHPRLVLLDEPSTGLDPAVRNSLWEYFETIRRDEGVTIVMTTHLLEEADRADRIAMLHRGKLVALDAPAALRGTVGGDSITITCDDPPSLAADIREAFHAAANVVDGAVRLEQSDGHRWIARLVEAFPGRIQTVTLGKPTLEDVFIDRCGERLAAGRRSGVSN